MRFEWKLLPLQRKLDWELDLARGRLAPLLRGSERAANALRALEELHADQSAAALAAARQRADPAAHRQALAYLAGMEARLAQARRQCAQLASELAAAQAECSGRHVRLEVVGALHDQALARFRYAAQRCIDKEADFAWIAHVAHGERL